MVDPFTGMSELNQAEILGSEWKGRASQHSTHAVQAPVSIEDVTTVHINELELKDAHGKTPDVFARMPSDRQLYGLLSSAGSASAAPADFDQALNLVLAEHTGNLG